MTVCKLAARALTLLPALVLVLAGSYQLRAESARLKASAPEPPAVTLLQGPTVHHVSHSRQRPVRGRATL